jgi:CspA family cold shock protein
MITGTVKLFHSSKCYNFIRRDTGGRDVFVHHSAVQIAGLTDLRKGQKLSFEIFDNQGKLAAKTCVYMVSLKTRHRTARPRPEKRNMRDAR